MKVVECGAEGMWSEEMQGERTVAVYMPLCASFSLVSSSRASVNGHGDEVLQCNITAVTNTHSHTHTHTL